MAERQFVEVEALACADADLCEFCANLFLVLPYARITRAVAIMELMVEVRVMDSVGPVAPSPLNCRVQLLCKSVRPRMGALPVRGLLHLHGARPWIPPHFS
jgi:hypothetical protein